MSVITGYSALNLNDTVFVQLTEHGRAVYRAHLESLGIPPIVPPVVREDPFGWSQWQLWDLMSIFGAATIMGRPLCFGTEMRRVIRTESPISSPIEGADTRRAGHGNVVPGGELPLLGSNQDSSDPESAVIHRGNSAGDPGKPAESPAIPSESPPLRHPPLTRPMGVAMGFDRHLGRAWVIG